MFYGNAANFIAYHQARGKEVPACWYSDKIEAALLVASEWLDRMFEDYWIGEKYDGYTQVRSWPRKYAQVQTNPLYTYPDDVVPDPVIYAVYEAAFRELTTPSTLQPDYTPSKYKSVSVEGAITVEYVLPQQPSDIQVQMPVVQSLMQPLMDENKSVAQSFYSGPLVRV